MEKFLRIFTSYGIIILSAVIFITTIISSFNGAFETIGEGVKDFLYNMVYAIVYGVVQLIPKINNSVFKKFN